MGTYYDVIFNFVGADGVARTFILISIKGEGLPFELWKALRSMKREGWGDGEFYSILADTLLEEPLEEYASKRFDELAAARIFVSLNVAERTVAITYEEVQPGSDSSNRHHEIDNAIPMTRISYSGLLDDPKTMEFFIGYELGDLETVTAKY